MIEQNYHIQKYYLKLIRLYKAKLKQQQQLQFACDCTLYPQPHYRNVVYDRGIYLK